MTIAEKLKKETGNSVHLYKEGVFWVAYERSAFVLSQYKSLKVTKKYIKVIGDEVVRVGFPSNVLPSFYSQLGTPIIKEEFYLVLQLDTSVVTDSFEDWKKQQNLWVEDVAKPNKKEESVVTDKVIAESQILNLISDYPLAEKTPLEVVMFLQNMKTLINKNA